MGRGTRSHLDAELSALLDDELDGAALHASIDHLRGCSHCRDELEALRVLRDGLRATPTPTPDLAFELRAALLVPAEDVGARDHGLTSSVAMAAAMGVALVLAVALAMGTETGGVTPDVDRLVVDHVGAVDGGPMVTPAQLTPVGG